MRIKCFMFWVAGFQCATAIYATKFPELMWAGAVITFLNAVLQPSTKPEYEEG